MSEDPEWEGIIDDPEEEGIIDDEMPLHAERKSFVGQIKKRRPQHKPNLHVFRPEYKRNSARIEASRIKRSGTQVHLDKFV